MNRAAAVRISGLRYAYPGLSTWALDAIDLEIQPGEWLAPGGRQRQRQDHPLSGVGQSGTAPDRRTLSGQVLIGERDTRQHPPSRWWTSSA
ncbi:hypothetical protein [Candidatus Amarolinea dominans]|uniref:hypothetical protein n=1 Tax=Candidatus Amarolinea dominans TaxID=3140696 RepID=UPI0031354E9F|nr:hypothetical protein [Anaerolineae bacterium]